jgi:uncharacterized membrane protein
VATTDRPVRLLDRPGWRTLRADPTGLVVGTLFALQAMTPSLMPRTWVFQAIASGVSGGIGYGIGVLVAALLGRSTVVARRAAWLGRRVPERVRSRLWVALLAAVPISLFVVLVVASDWQRETRALLGLPPETSSGWLRAAPVIVAVAAVMVAAFRLGRLVARWIARALRRHVRLPRRLAQAVGLLVVVAVGFGLFDGVLLRWALNAADTTFSVADDQTPRGVEPPQSPDRSGSPESLSSWDTPGMFGQAFVAGGPSRERMATASGLPEADVLDPIRVYVGLEGAATPEARAALAVRELVRTGAFARTVRGVITSTGTGWVEPAAPRALELMYGGDTAVVSTQYSYLPSWISFLFDRPRADEEGRALFDAVYDRLQQVPEGSRPKLLVYGISLGSTGSEAAFDGITDLRDRTDGVLWAGPPNDSTLWRDLVERRDPGTTEVAPVYAGGLIVRFGDSPADLLEPDSTWLPPRIAFLVHPTDPVVWWSPELLFTRPDWLEEPRGRGVSPSMRWYPVVTFWQLSLDLANAAYPPQGYGHNYSSQLLDAWALIAPPPGWTAADTERARAVFR